MSDLIINFLKYQNMDLSKDKNLLDDVDILHLVAVLQLDYKGTNRLVVRDYLQQDKEVPQSLATRLHRSRVAWAKLKAMTGADLGYIDDLIQS